MYRFKIPIGDGSNDGHGKCIYILVQSNFSVKEVREIYFEACEKTGIEFSKFLCADYVDCSMNEHQIEILTDVGIDMTEIFDVEKLVEISEKGKIYLEVDDFYEIFVRFLQTANPYLEIFRIPDEDFPMLPFYGRDEQGRHIGHLGYGLFE